jgi:uncharacterized membrane protein (UPF0136 family)
MSRLLVTLATSFLPPSRRAWGQAMKAEYDALPERQDAFALGCLGASLRENVTTGEGWARLGFWVILVLAGLLGLWFISEVITLITDPRGHFFMQATGFLMLFGFILMLAVIARATFTAMEEPTNRFLISCLGLRVAPRLMMIFGLVATFSVANQAYWFARIAPAWFNLDVAKYFLLNDGFCAVVVFIIGYVSQKGAREMLVSGLVGAITLAASGITAYYLDRGKLEGFFIASDRVAILLIVFAIAGSVLMWMERPAKVVG